MVAASADPAIKTGDRLVSINGIESVDWESREESLVSGSPQWRHWQLANELCSGPIGTTVSLRIERNGRTLDARLTYQKQVPTLSPPRPDPVTQLNSGVWYLDLTRASQQDMDNHLTELSQARALIIDLRGYPTPMTGMELLRHVLAEPEHTRWMHMPLYETPFGEPVSYTELGWDLVPATPRFIGRLVVLTDGQAISQAESILGYFSDLHLATIVGTPSAGANGDVQYFYTPSGYRISFTGLRVTRHNSAESIHLRGVTPDITVSPSLQDVRAGRDVVLEEALRFLQ